MMMERIHQAITRIMKIPSKTLITSSTRVVKLSLESQKQPSETHNLQYTLLKAQTLQIKTLESSRSGSLLHSLPGYARKTHVANLCSPVSLQAWASELLFFTDLTFLHCSGSASERDRCPRVRYSSVKSN